MYTEIRKNNKINKGKIYSFFSKLGSAMLLPISILPFVGLIISVGNIIDYFGLNNIGSYLINFSIILFSFFSILVFLSIAFNFEKNKNGLILIWASVFLVLFLLFSNLFYFLISKYFSNLIYLEFNLFMAILLGMLFPYFYEKYLANNIHYKIIPFTFFITIFMFVISYFLYLIIFSLSFLITVFPFGMNSFLYGFLNRLFLPFGLHTILIPIFLYSPIGGSLYVLNDSTSTFEIVASGDSVIWMYAYVNNIPFQVIDKFMGSEFTIDGVTYFVTDNTNPGQYQQGFFPIMIFCFPAAGYSLSRKTDDKFLKKAILISSVIPMMTGITEPFEFLFVFYSFPLYIFHAFMTGLSFLFLSILNVNVWLSSGWFIDIILYGLIPSIVNGLQTNFYYIFIVGIILSIFYFYAFKFFDFNFDLIHKKL